MREKGITLIVLIVTIVVLIILITASFSIVFNGEIINKSKNAIDMYAGAVENSNGELDAIGNAVNRYLSKENNNSVDDNKLLGKVEVGDYIIYDPTYGVVDDTVLSYSIGRGELVVTSPVDEHQIINESGVDWYEFDKAYELLTDDGQIDLSNVWVESGDELYAGIGGDGANFTARIYNNMWRVVDDGESSGVIKIEPQYIVMDTYGSSLSLKGLASFTYAIRELNRCCRIFGYGYGALEASCITLPSCVDRGLNLCMGLVWDSSTHEDVGAAGEPTSYWIASTSVTKTQNRISASIVSRIWNGKHFE